MFFVRFQGAVLFGEETIALPGGNDSFAPRKAIVFAEVLGCLFFEYAYCIGYQYFAFTLKEQQNPGKFSASPTSGKCDIWNTFQTLHKGHTTSVALSNITPIYYIGRLSRFKPPPAAKHCFACNKNTTKKQALFPFSLCPFAILSYLCRGKSLGKRARFQEKSLEKRA